MTMAGNLLTATVIGAANTPGNSTPITNLGHFVDLLVELDCQAAPTGGSPTLDVYLQTTYDSGDTWQDIAHFQFTGTAVKKLWQIAGRNAGSSGSIATSNQALAGDTVRQGPWGDQIQLAWAFAQGGSTGNYTLAAHARFKGAR